MPYVNNINCKLNRVFMISNNTVKMSVLPQFIYI